MTDNVTPFDQPRRRRPTGAKLDDAERAAREAIAKLDGAKPGPGETDQDAARVSAGDGPPTILYPPLVVPMVLTCPSCGDTATIEAKLSARVTKDSDGQGALALRTRAPKAAHVCGQLALGIAEAERSR